MKILDTVIQEPGEKCIWLFTDRKGFVKKKNSGNASLDNIFTKFVRRAGTSLQQYSSRDLFINAYGDNEASFDEMDYVVGHLIDGS
ncbi:MAG: hypothetical protein V2I33_22715 [Kangiellaceae bacterium]|jgi:hypothetical protein|nr:hypothetical protein [Kangiellaceae bacterium]